MHIRRDEDQAEVRHHCNAQPKHSARLSSIRHDQATASAIKEPLSPPAQVLGIQSCSRSTLYARHNATTLHSKLPCTRLYPNLRALMRTNVDPWELCFVRCSLPISHLYISLQGEHTTVKLYH